MLYNLKVKQTLHTATMESLLQIKGEKMKLQNIIYPLAMGVGIGVAMSVALNDTSVGVAIGIAVAVAFAYTNSSNKTEPK